MGVSWTPDWVPCSFSRPVGGVNNPFHWVFYWLGEWEWVGGGQTRTCSRLIGAAEGVFDLVHES